MRMASLRPMASEIGPKNSSPNTMPKMKRVTMSCVSLASAMARAVPMSRSAGSMASMLSAVSEVVSENSATNSGRLSGGLIGLDIGAGGMGGGKRSLGAPPPPAQCQGCNRSEEHTSELQSLMRNSYAVLCLKKKNIKSREYKADDSK